MKDMNTSKKIYLIPTVDNLPVAAMHCLCDSGNPPTPTPDISYGGGAGENNQTTPF